MSWLGLTLLSALALATADAMSKRYLAHHQPGHLVLVRFGFGGLLVIGQPPISMVQIENPLLLG